MAPRFQRAFLGYSVKDVDQYLHQLESNFSAEQATLVAELDSQNRAVDASRAELEQIDRNLRQWRRDYDRVLGSLEQWSARPYMMLQEAQSGLSQHEQERRRQLAELSQFSEALRQTLLNAPSALRNVFDHLQQSLSPLQDQERKPSLAESPRDVAHGAPPEHLSYVQS